MLSDEIKIFKEDIVMLKHDIKVLNDIVKYADKNIDSVKPATKEKFQNHIDKLINKLEVVNL